MNCTGNYRNLGQDPWEAFCLFFDTSYIICVHACFQFGDGSHARATPGGYIVWVDGILNSAVRGQKI